MDTLTFKCPDCGTKLRPVETMQVATQVVRRTCVKKACGARWQLVVAPIAIREGVRIDKAVMVPVIPGILNAIG
jgi:transcription elongation factor Elf1